MALPHWHTLPSFSSSSTSSLIFQLSMPFWFFVLWWNIPIEERPAVKEATVWEHLLQKSCTYIPFFLSNALWHLADSGIFTPVGKFMSYHLHFPNKVFWRDATDNACHNCGIYSSWQLCPSQESFTDTHHRHYFCECNHLCLFRSPVTTELFCQCAIFCGFYGSFCNKSYLTKIADMQFFASMESLVINHVSSLSEAFLVDTADLGLFASVQLFVPIQVSFCDIIFFKHYRHEVSHFHQYAISGD